MADNIRFLHQETSIANIGNVNNTQSFLLNENDSDLGHRAFGYVDGAGNPFRLCCKDQNAQYADVSLLDADHGGTQLARLIHSGDTNTYFEFQADQIKLTCGGIDSATITATTATLSVDLYIPEYLYHVGDTDTFLRYQTNQLGVNAGGVNFINVQKTTQDILEINPAEVDVDFVVNANSVSNALFVQGSDGNVGIGTATPTLGRLQVQDGLNALSIGADSGATTLTTSTIKVGKTVFPHYDNSEEPVLLSVCESNATNNIVNIGGGTSTGNAATLVRVFTTADTTTLEGTERLRIASDGGIFAYAIPAGTDNSVLVLNSSNEIVTDEIDSKVWAGSLVDGSGTENYVSKWTAAGTQGDSQIFDNGTNVGLGIATMDSKLHVHLASAGTIAAVAGTVITAENSANCYLSLLGGNSNICGVLFGDDGDADNGYIKYDHNSLVLSFGVNAVPAFRMLESGGDMEYVFNNLPTDGELRIQDIDIGATGVGYIKVSNGSATGYITVQSSQPTPA